MGKEPSSLDHRIYQNISKYISNESQLFNISQDKINK